MKPWGEEKEAVRQKIRRRANTRRRVIEAGNEQLKKRNTNSRSQTKAIFNQGQRAVKENPSNR